MSKNLTSKTVNGIECYSPDVAGAYTDYPEEGFEITDKKTLTSFWVQSRNRLFKSIIFRYVAPASKSKFLEIGCGTGDFIQQIVSNENLEITGSEIYIKGLEFAKKNIPSVEFVQFDATQGIIGQKFHIICAFDVIEHIDDDEVALANMYQMLCDDGALIISVPQHMFLWSRLDEIVKHKRRYSRGVLLEKLKKSGFEIDYATSFLFILFPLMLVSRLFDKKNDVAKDDDLEKRVVFSRMTNSILNVIMRIDEFLIRLGFSLPFGGTLVVVAKRRR